jgi:hypothetical protein
MRMNREAKKHNHVERTDDEIDAVKLAYQVSCVTEPRFGDAQRPAHVLELLDSQYAQLKRLSAASMAHAFTDFGLVDRYHSGVESTPLWQRVRFGTDERKVIFHAWRTSCVLVGGVYQPGRTQDVNEAVYQALHRHIADVMRRWRRRPRKHSRQPPTLKGIEAAEIFRLRCMFGFGTSAEVRRAGFLPGRRYGGVQKPLPRNEFKRPETVGDRYTALERRIAVLESAVGIHA